ncbi:hypothetical protein BKA81DRAFT_95974 [Phyllosticta paracitricarpa]
MRSDASRRPDRLLSVDSGSHDSSRTQNCMSSLSSRLMGPMCIPWLFLLLRSLEPFAMMESFALLPPLSPPRPQRLPAPPHPSRRSSSITKKRTNSKYPLLPRAPLLRPRREWLALRRMTPTMLQTGVRCVLLFCFCYGVTVSSDKAPESNFCRWLASNRSFLGRLRSSLGARSCGTQPMLS